MDKKGFKYRVSFKVSDDTSPDDIEKEIRRAFGNNSFVLDEKAKEQMKAIAKSKSNILKIIQPFYDDLKTDNSKEGNKKRNELIDLGKFIYNLNSNSTIEIVGIEESPDFILNVNNQRIGIEHTRLVNQDKISSYKNISKVFSSVKKKILERGLLLKGIYNLRVDVEKININGKDLRQLLTEKEDVLHDEIINYIIAYNENKNAAKPDYITDLTHFNCNDFDIALSEDYILEDLSTEKLLLLLESKEQKIDNYKANFNLTEVWLLVVFDGGLEMSSFDIQLEKLPVNHPSKFDWVYIFNNFTGGIFHGKPNR